MKKRKTILAALVLALLLLIGGAIAYFTDTDSKNNQFTLGSVDIELVEPSYTTAAATDIVPGTVIAKDPTVNNIGRNSAFVFLSVKVDCLDDTPLFTYTVNPGWTLLQDGECDFDTLALTRYYYYGSNGELTELAKEASTPALFDNVTLMQSLSSAAAAGFEQGKVKVQVDAYGIQSRGLSDTTPAGVFANFGLGTGNSGNGNG